MITPHLEDGFNDKHTGDVSIASETFTLRGMIAGCVIVRDGGHFILYGMVVGNVNVDSQSKATIHGIVTGSVTGDGVVEIFGVVQNSLK